MKSTWKYILKVKTTQEIEIPLDAKVLHAGEQHGEICIWCEVNPDHFTETRTFQVYGTGHSMPPANRKFINTVLMSGGYYVYHVYELIREVDK